MPDDQKVVLSVPTNRRLPNEHDLNVGVDHIDVIVTVDPSIETRGEHQSVYGADLIRLREWDEQVLLHELLHVATARSRWWRDPQRQVSDPHGHDVISRIEVALWETGWRRVDRGALAKAWDEGAKCAGSYGHEDDWTHDMHPFDDNPYRATPTTPEETPVLDGPSFGDYWPTSEETQP